jgi:hypothetical protein
MKEEGNNKDKKLEERMRKEAQNKVRKERGHEKKKWKEEER